MIHVPLLVNRFQKSGSLIVQYKYLKSCSEDFILQNLILRTRSCGTGFITKPSWLLHFQPTKMVGRKCFVPVRYQLRRGISGGPALKYFCMIHRVGWIYIDIHISMYTNINVHNITHSAFVSRCCFQRKMQAAVYR